MKNITKKALVVAIIAGVLVFIDGIIAKYFNESASFTWVAFVSWTVFFGATTKERFKAVLGYVIGFLAALAILYLGKWLSFIPISILGVSIATILAAFIINFLCMELEVVKNVFPISISGIFVGIGMTFSGLGIGLSPDSLKNAMLMLTIIVLYGILGLLCGWATLKFSPKEE